MQRTCNSFIFIVALCVLCLAPSTICDESAIKDNIAVVENTKAQEKSVANISENKVINNQNKNITAQQTGKNITLQSAPAIGGNKTVVEHSSVSSVSSEPTKDGHPPTVNSGAVLRGFYVLAGLSLLALAYIVFRSFGLNKQRPQMVRKYGVLAHRQDIEMRPLPLDEDDDDDTTVFDVSGITSSRPQS